MKIGTNNVRGIRVGAKSVRAYLGSKLILPQMTITGEWKSGMTDKNVRAVISGEVNLFEKVDAYSVDFEPNAVLTIKGGARLRVWEGGCNTNAKENLVIEAQDGNFGSLLVNPAVTPSHHPHGIVQLISKAHGSTIAQHFGVPAYNGIKIADIVKVGHNYGTVYKYWDNASNNWATIQTPQYILEPFRGYNMLIPSASSGNNRYALPCEELYGNMNASLAFISGWNYNSNSYTSEIDTHLLLVELAKYGINSIYVNVPNDNNDWEEQTLDNITIPYIEPITGMVAIQYQGSSSVEVTIDYKAMVWDASFRKDAEELAAQSRGAKGTKKANRVVLDEKAIAGTPMENPKMPAEFEEK